MHRHINSSSAKMSYLVIDTSKAMSYEEDTWPDTWTIAKVAHDKLVAEAAFPDRDLRKIVAHATLYDRLLDEYHASSPPQSPDSGPEDEDFDMVSEEESVMVGGKEDGHHTQAPLVEHAELALVKVASHSDNMTRSHAEIAVEEVEIFDDD